MNTHQQLQAQLDKAKARTWVISAVIIALFLVLGSVGWYYHGKHVAKLNAELDQSYLLIQDYKVTKAHDQSLIGTIKQTAGSEHAARLLAEKQIKELDVKLKNIKSVVKTVFVVDVDTFRAEITKHDTIDGEGIPYGSTFSYSDTLKYISGTINETHVSIDSLTLAPSSVTVTIAAIKKGFFKKAEPSVIVDFSNPYFTPVSGQNVVVKDTRKKPILLSRTAMLVYGFVLGAVLIK